MDSKLAKKITPNLQEVPLAQFTNSAGRYSFSFLSFISQGRISIVYQGGKYFIRKSFGDKVKLVEITGFIYAQIELAQLLFL
jgi:hypothetical protein